jgi:hypothetical protein
MGAYYILASLYDVRSFFLWTVPFRCVTFTVLTYGGLTDGHSGLISIAVMELIGAIATGVGLYLDARKKKH